MDIWKAVLSMDKWKAMSSLSVNSIWKAWDL